MTKSRHDFSESSNRRHSEFDDDGIPQESPVADWLDLASPIPSRWLQAILRFSRIDGSIVFQPAGRSLGRLRQLEVMAEKIGDPSLIGVVARWIGSNSSTIPPASPPPVAFDSRPDRPLAVLRSDWNLRGDLLAIDHRQPGPETLLEIGSRGQVWLGPTWSSTLMDGNFTRPKPVSWSSNPFAQSLEWSFKAGSTRICRQMTLLRARSMALVGEQVEGAFPESEMRLRLADGIEAESVPDSRAMELRSGPGKPKARLIPLGLPSHDRPTDLGSISIEGREIVVRQKFEGRRGWLPILITWGALAQTWRPLTVASRSKAQKGDQAVAYRIAWGARDPGLVVYRSLGPRTLRSFLGCQTSSRFLVGSLSRTGDIAPILKVDL